MQSLRAMPTSVTSLANKTRTLLEMIKFSHTVFAFPFALMGLVLVALDSGAPPTLGQIFWICVAMVGARSSAMGLNRIIDARIDAENPRTASRHIPAGEISLAEAWLFVILATLVFLGAAWMLNFLCFILAGGALGLFILYAYCKRFTPLAHLVLGLCLAGAPIGAWIAVRGDLGWPVLVSIFSTPSRITSSIAAGGCIRFQPVWEFPNPSWWAKFFTGQ